MDGGAWWAAVHRVARSRTRLSDFTFTFHFHALEKEMATHSRVLAWRIPGTGLLSIGSQSQTRLKRHSSSSSIQFSQYHLLKVCSFPMVLALLLKNQLTRCALIYLKMKVKLLSRVQLRLFGGSLIYSFDRYACPYASITLFR